MIKIYNQNSAFFLKIHQKQFIVTTKLTLDRRFKGKQLPPNGWISLPNMWETSCFQSQCSLLWQM